MPCASCTRKTHSCGSGTAPEKTQKILRTKGGVFNVFSEPSFFLRTYPAQPIQLTTQTNNTWRLPGWLRASCGRHMRAVRLCHTTSQWRGTAAQQDGCCTRMSTVLLLVCQHIEHVAWGSSAGTKSASCASSLVLHHHVGAGLEKHIQGSARARRQSVRRNRQRRCYAHVPSAWHLCRRFASFHRQRLQLIPETLGSERTPPLCSHVHSVLRAAAYDSPGDCGRPVTASTRPAASTWCISASSSVFLSRKNARDSVPGDSHAG